MSGKAEDSSSRIAERDRPGLTSEDARQDGTGPHDECGPRPERDGGREPPLGALPRRRGSRSGRWLHAAAIRVSVSQKASSWRPMACCTTARSEEHTSELQSLMRISYAVFCLKKKKKQQTHKSL